MAEATKVPAKTEEKSAAIASCHPVEALRREVDRLFEDFGVHGLWRSRRGLRRSFFRRAGQEDRGQACSLKETAASASREVQAAP